MTDESEYYKLRQRFCDDFFKKEFDIYHANQPSLYLLLSLMSVSYCRLPNIQWTDSLMQLTDWNRVDHQKVIDLYRLNIFSLLHHSDIFARIFSEFLQDASRAGKYTVTAKTFACASLKLLDYLSCYRLAVPINIQYTRNNLTSRRTLPWHWSRHMKYLGRLRVMQTFEHQSKVYSEPSPSWEQDVRELYCPKLYSRLKRQDTCFNATYIALKYLPELLRRSAASDELVTFATAEKPFSPPALQYPAYVKKYKKAINAYLTRVQRRPETQLSASGA